MAETLAGAGAVPFRPDGWPSFRGAPWWTPAERVVAAGRGPAHGAGRLAAKMAVLDLLGLAPDHSALAEVEVLPQRTARCSGGPACPLGHPPGVRLRDGLARRFPGVSVSASISHSTTLAVAVATHDAAPPTATGPGRTA